MNLKKLLQFISLLLTLYTAGCIGPPPLITKMEELIALEQYQEAIEVGEELLKQGSLDNENQLKVMFLVANSHRSAGNFANAIEKYRETNDKHLEIRLNDKSFKDEHDVKPRCDIGIIFSIEYDKRDVPYDSEDYTILAWNYLDGLKFDIVRKIINICFEDIPDLEELAKEQQKKYNREPRKDYWALNHMGTLIYVKGWSYEDEGDRLKGLNYQLRKNHLYIAAIDCYSELQKYTGAHCYPKENKIPWNVWDVARNHMKIILEEKIEKEPVDGILKEERAPP